MIDMPAGLIRSPRVHRRTVNAAVIATFDCIALVAALLVGLLLAWAFKELFLGEQYEIFYRSQELKSRFLFYLLLVCIYVGVSGFRGNYSERAPFWDEVRVTIQSVILLGLIDAFIQYASKQDLSRLWLVFTWGAAAPCLIFFRSFAIRCLDQIGFWKLKTMLVCPPVSSQRVLEAIDSDVSLGYQIVKKVTSQQFLNELESKDCELMSGDGIDFLIILPEENLDHSLTEKVMRAAIRKRVPYALAPAIDGLASFEFIPQHFYSQDIVLMHARQNLFRPINLFMKRTLDIIGSLLLLLLVIPVLIVLAVFLCRDGGSPFYSHLRVGRGGKEFKCLKLRTMISDNEGVLQEFLEANPIEKKNWEENHKLQVDPRVTHLGGFLRKTSIDEIPQIFNVLRGEMSLVGPRPIVREEVEKYADWFELYREVTPGITGLWQVSGRNSKTYEERVALDRWYVTNWSIWLDFTILMRTVPTLLFHRNGL